MVQICKRCRHANPREASYCYHDGICLDDQAGGAIPATGAAIDVGALRFPVPFVFPSGESCRNFKELARTCQKDPMATMELLRNGHLEAFLAAQGRSDLAAAAGAAGRAADRELGFDEFLGRLPGAGLVAAKLNVAPAVIELGTVRIGEDRRLELTLQNEGTRLIYGSAVCAADWLALGDGPAMQNRLFKFTTQELLPVRVLGRQLRARDQAQEADIQVESNAGKAMVKVRVYVPVKPFAEGVLAGSLSPRQAAFKMKDAPLLAAAFLESGAMAHWYEANGWTYPVIGPTATGMAAVQQFLEALGVVRMPPVELGEDAVSLRGLPGENIEYPLAVITQTNRAAWAFGKSDQPWLHVGQPVFRGRSAYLPLSVTPVRGRPGETQQAVVSITANGGQHFEVPVTLVIAAPATNATAPVAVPVHIQPAARPKTAVPIMTTPVRPMAKPVTALPAVPGRAPPPADGKERRLTRTLIPAALLLAIISAAALRDYLAPAHQGTGLQKAVIDDVPRIELRFHDEKRDDELEKLWMTDPLPTMRFGVVMLRNGKEFGQGANVKRLTFDPWGRTNNTCLRFDGNDERLFGGAQGNWEERAAKSWKDDKGQNHEGVRSIWVCDDKKIRVSQFVELVRGDQSNLLDTCRVRYRIENPADGQEREVGIRFLLDTFIGGNDNVPFTIPGESDLCDTMKDLPAQAKEHTIPNFVQALEKPDLAHPGTIAHLRLKLEGLEAPQRVTVGAWPNEKLRVLDRKASGPGTLWEVPLVPMKSLDLNDSAVTIYWKEAPLKPGTQREVGFEYGLWNLASQSSRLAATVDGAFRPDGELTVIAYVNRSADDNADQSVSLTVPESFKLLEGGKTQPVPALPEGVRNGNVPVTWKVQAGPTGVYEFVVTTSTGVSQTLHVVIRKSIY